MYKSAAIAYIFYALDCSYNRLTQALSDYILINVLLNIINPVYDMQCDHPPRGRRVASGGYVRINAGFRLRVL